MASIFHATEALISAPNNYQGTWDASLGVLPATSSAIGDFYRVTTGGTIDGVLCRTGDRIVVIDTPTQNTMWCGEWIRIPAEDYVSEHIIDSDGDTFVELESSVDEDTIRFQVAGTEIATMLPTGRIDLPTYAGVNDGSTVVALYVDAGTGELRQGTIGSGSGILTFQGNWDPTTGAFPGGGTALTGAYYEAVADGIVDGVEFAAGDTIFAKTDNASQTTYVSNWLKVDNTNNSLVSPDGDTSVVVSNDDILLGANNITFIDIDGVANQIQLSGAITMSGNEIIDDDPTDSALYLDGATAELKYGYVKTLQDRNQNTRVEVEQVINDQTIRFTADATEVMQINEPNGLTISRDIEITSNTRGLILQSPDGTRWSLGMNNDGSLRATSL